MSDTAEETLYESTKKELAVLVDNLTKKLSALKVDTDKIRNKTGNISDILPTPESSPALGWREKLRRSIGSKAPSRHIIEACLDISNEILISEVEFHPPSSEEYDIAFLERTITIYDATLHNANLRSDQVILNQKISFSTKDAKVLYLWIKIPLFLGFVKGGGGQVAVKPLTNPVVLSDDEGEFVTDIIYRMLTAASFQGKIGGKFKLDVPEFLKKSGAIANFYMANHSSLRLYFSSGYRFVTVSAPDPANKESITIKLTSPSLRPVFIDGVQNKLAAAGLKLGALNVGFDAGNQNVVVRVEVLYNYSQDFGGVRVSASVHARVAIRVMMSGTGTYDINVQSVGNTILENAWIAGIHAHKDSPIPIGGGIGVSVPDAATDFFMGLAENLGLSLPDTLPAYSFNEIIPTNPAIVESISVRSSDLVLVVSNFI